MATDRPHAGTVERVKQLSRDAGFDRCRITTALPLHVERARHLRWLADQRHGAMRWMTPERATRSAEPAAVFPPVRSVVCVGLAYWAGHRQRPAGISGAIARYAWGEDYHAVMGRMLEAFAADLRREFGGEYRWFVDTGPVMDKGLAARSGLGWYGKNTNILTDDFGSFVLLGEVMTTVSLVSDAPLGKDCGTCRLCVVACPTGALGPDYTIDARRCISYLTIEHREAIPLEFRTAVGDWVFGCDICQEVCPPTMRPYLKSRDERRAWAQNVRETVSGTVSAPAIESPVHEEKSAASNPLLAGGSRQSVDLVWLLRLTHDQYLEAFRGSAIRRAKVWMLRRNAAIALGNVGDPACIGDLRLALLEDDHPVVRGHAAWALGQVGLRHGVEHAWTALQESERDELDRSVQHEVAAALSLRPISSAP